MSEIRRILRREIAECGAIPFARFMELALYCPDYGFYEKEADTIGRGGHFFTSVSVGPVFGQLLARDFTARITRWEADASIQIAEQGAHDGRLALDLLDWLRDHRPDIYDRIRYCIIEGSGRRRDWQSQTLSKHQARICWVWDVRGLATGLDSLAMPLILFANELLDAFPVHRMGWSRKDAGWFEWGVGLGAGDVFTWVALPQPSRETLPLLPDPSQASSLPDGYIIEVSPSAARWWGETAAAVAGRKHGFLMTIDYGLTREDRLLPERTSGTLRAYRNHRASTAVLEDPGGQDITAHVDFTLLQREGERAGLATEDMLPQGRHLARVAAASPEITAGWDAADIRQFQTLTRPEHLGAVFKVLGQGK
jgi:SAM-dependent MidA family methyltransferase